jgi:hypothetical protein
VVAPSSSLLSTVASNALSLERGVNGSGDPRWDAGEGERDMATVGQKAIDVSSGADIKVLCKEKIVGKEER